MDAPEGFDRGNAERSLHWSRSAIKRSDRVKLQSDPRGSRSACQRTGISASYISLVEHEKRDPSISILVTIAKSLNIPLFVIIFMYENGSDLVGMDKVLREKLPLAILGVLND